MLKSGERRLRELAGAAGWLPNALGEIGRDLLARSGRHFRDALSRLNGRWAHLGRAIEAAADLCAVVLKTVTGVAASLLEAPVLLVGGLVLLRARPALEGPWGPVSAVAGGAILVLAKLVSLAQTILGREAPSRPLGAEEARLLGALFGASLPLRSLRVVQGGAGLFSTNDRPFTLGDTIYLKRAPPEPGLLVHEATHVWQYRHRGPRYAFDAILAQAAFRDAYDWSGPLARQGARGGGWLALNPEAQAQLVEESWRVGLWKGEHARDALQTLRARRSPRLTRQEERS